MSRVFVRALKYGLIGTTAAVGASEYASASGDALLPAWLTWPHNGMYNTQDLSSVRRGFEVYKQVCSACHSMQFLKFRQLVGITHTEAEVKAIAAEYEIEHEDPNEEGEMFMRPRGLLDGFPAPYPNKVSARLANNGANPPDLSLMIFGRTHGLDGLYGDDYVYHLLTGYCDPPAGVTMGEGQNYNPYFAGGAIGMAPPLYNEIIQYDDGTPATMSQLASDVVQFLNWSSDKHGDERKEKGIKLQLMAGTLTLLLLLTKRNDFAGIKSGTMSWRKLGEKPMFMYNGKPRYN